MQALVGSALNVGWMNRFLPARGAVSPRVPAVAGFGATMEKKMLLDGANSTACRVVR